MSYQDLQAYHGSIYGPTRYNGIEYNNELADSLVLGSPGGVDSISGHYSGGFYSYKSSSADIYQNDERYISGVFGDLYSPNYDSTVIGSSSNNNYLSSSNVPQDPYDDIYIANSSFPPSMQLDSAQSSVKGFSRVQALGHPPPPYSYPSLERRNFDDSDQFQKIAPVSNSKQSKKKSIKENFVGDGKSTIPQTSVENFTSDTRKIRVNPTFLFVSFLLVYFCIALWSSTLYEFLKTKFFSGKDIPWTWLAILATVLTFIFFGVTYIFDIPLLEFDKE